MKILDRVILLKEKIFASSFLAAGLIVLLSTLAKVISIFAITKYLSIRFDPEALGIYGQSQSFINLIIAFSTLSSSIGITKYLSEYKSNPILRTKIAVAAWDITFICSLAVSSLIVIFSSYISREIFFSDRYTMYVVLIGVSVFCIGSYKTKIAIMNGYFQFKSIGIWDIIFNMCTFLVVILFTQLVIDSLILTIPVVYCLLFLFMNKKLRLNPLKAFNRIKRFKSIVFPLTKYAALMFIQTAIGYLIEIILRAFLVHEMSLNDLGLYEGMNKISGAVLLPVSSIISIYFLPIFSDKSTGTFTQIIINSLKKVVPFLVLALFFVWFFCQSIINIILSPQFLILQNYISIQLAGLFFSVINLIYLNALLGRGKIKLVLFLATFNSFLFLIFNYFLINKFQLAGVFYSYTLSSISGLLVYIVVHIVSYRKRYF